MREIKFRAWDKETKTMLDLVHQINFLNKQIWAEGNGEHSFCCHLDKYELMQYTRLLDKNGKEIYEGDILKGHYGLEKVIWEEHGCGFYPFSVNPNFNGEVIGNIYENKELLEVK